MEENKPLTEVQATADTLILTGDFPNLTPATMFDCWTKPELLTKWWVEAAETEPVKGGLYHLSWPTRNWHLRSHYTAYEPPRVVAFTWQWEHEPDVPMREVEVTIHPREAGGCRLTIIHGPYTDAAQEQDDRQSHIEGWQYFCAKLKEVQID